MSVNEQAASQVRDSLFGLIATWLAKGTRDLIHDYPAIPVNTSKYRTFTFEGAEMLIVSRAPNDEVICPGVNVYFGNDVADQRYVLPQIWHLPMMIHVMVPWTTDRKNVGDRQAMRLGAAVMDAFEGLGAKLQLHDFTQSPPVPTDSRFVTWAHRTRGDWQEAGDPFREVFTNRIWTREFRYTR